jgi:DHA1 family multidrug resistance protein-like MFS transporter
MEMLRESSIGHIVRFLSRDKLLSWPNEYARFDSALKRVDGSSKPELTDAIKEKSHIEDLEAETPTFTKDTIPKPLYTTRASEGMLLVGWYSTHDDENPQNWSNLKRYSVGILIWQVSRQALFLSLLKLLI